MSTAERCGAFRSKWKAFALCALLLFVTNQVSLNARGTSSETAKHVLPLSSHNARLPFAPIQDKVFREKLSNLPQGVEAFSGILDSTLFFENTPDNLVADSYQHKAKNPLPAPSEVMFQEPTPWERYRIYILAMAVFLVTETALVAMLLVQRQRTRRAKALLERRF